MNRNRFLSNIASFAKSNGVKLAVVGGSLVPMFSHAAIDTTAATAGVSDAQTAILAVLGAMITLGIAVWGTKKVLKYFRG